MDIGYPNPSNITVYSNDSTPNPLQKGHKCIKHTPNRSSGILVVTWTQFHNGTKAYPNLDHIIARTNVPQF